MFRTLSLPVFFFRMGSRSGLNVCLEWGGVREVRCRTSLTPLASFAEYHWKPLIKYTYRIIENRNKNVNINPMRRYVITLLSMCLSECIYIEYCSNNVDIIEFNMPVAKI